MAVAEGKKRYNLHLHKENAEFVRDFLKGGCGWSLSTLVDVYLSTVANRIKKSGLSSDGAIGFNELFEVLNVTDVQKAQSKQAMVELIRSDPELAAKLIEEHNFEL